LPAPTFRFRHRAIFKTAREDPKCISSMRRPIVERRFGPVLDGLRRRSHAGAGKVLKCAVSAVPSSMQVAQVAVVLGLGGVVVGHPLPRWRALAWAVCGFCRRAEVSVARLERLDAAQGRLTRPDHRSGTRGFFHDGFRRGVAAKRSQGGGVQHQLATYYFKTKEELWMMRSPSRAKKPTARPHDKLAGVFAFIEALQKLIREAQALGVVRLRSPSARPSR
jgi:hypothetical protein